ncbi:hypothetical protein RIF29_14544 [Crotalaria pallida]|uniref:X8 domain-containing protein n=1 Tax=Crotalaria pallida TaxID=3830 RepID=A0AAN9FHZ3_CROPI
MNSGAYVLRVSIAILCILVLASTLFSVSDAKKHGRALEGRKISRSSFIKSWKKLKSVNRLNKYSSMEYSNFDSYGSPSSLPLSPFNSLAPQPTPQTSSPASLYPPYPSLTPPSSQVLSPVPSPPHNIFGPPNSNNIVSPPPPPNYVSSPPKHAPNPPKSSVPSPPQVYLPPVVYPPPPSSSSSPHHNRRPEYAVWCVAKPTVPDPIVQAAMDYACGSGADCKSIQPNGSCYQPNTLLAHASYAFNSYWQNTKSGGGTCDFGGTAMLVTVDPSKQSL